MDASVRTLSSKSAQGPAKASAGVVAAVCRDSSHRFTKPNVDSIELVAGLGVKGDAHLGKAVQHLVRVREDPTRPNLRQVHLIHAELHDELNALGFSIKPGDIGENITTRGLDLLRLPKGTRLHIGARAVVEVTGLRNPCRQVEAFRPGLMAALIGRDGNGEPVLKSGIMSIVLAGGEIRPGDFIVAELPAGPHEKLRRV